MRPNLALELSPFEKKKMGTNFLLIDLLCGLMRHVCCGCLPKDILLVSVH